MKRTFLIFCKLALVMLVAGDCLRMARASGPLAWNTNDFLYIAKPGDVTGHLNLHVTNLAVYEVIIKGVKPSCGCTVAKMPATPWRIKPGATDHLELLIDLRGKRGELYKQLTIDSSDAPDVLNFTVRIPDPGTNELSEDAQMRIWGQELGATDHQAVFKQNCVKCHLKPGFREIGGSAVSQCLWHLP